MHSIFYHIKLHWNKECFRSDLWLSLSPLFFSFIDLLQIPETSWPPSYIQYVQQFYRALPFYSCNVWNPSNNKAPSIFSFPPLRRTNKGHQQAWQSRPTPSAGVSVSPTAYVFLLTPWKLHYDADRISCTYQRCHSG